VIKQFGATLERAFMDTVFDPQSPDEVADFIEQIAENFRLKNRTDCNL